MALVSRPGREITSIFLWSPKSYFYKASVSEWIKQISKLLNGWMIPSSSYSVSIMSWKMLTTSSRYYGDCSSSMYEENVGKNITFSSWELILNKCRETWESPWSGDLARVRRDSEVKREGGAARLVYWQSLKHRICSQWEQSVVKGRQSWEQCCNWLSENLFPTKSVLVLPSAFYPGA